MTHTELNQVIREYMRDIYKAEFIGKLKIEDIEPIGYKVSFYLDNPEYPLVIIGDMPDEEFIPYIKEELRSRKLIKTKYFRTIKLPPEQLNMCK